jgi:hypothetical protein
VRNFRAATTDPLFIVVDGGEWGGGGGETGPDTVAPGSALHGMAQRRKRKRE